MSDMQKAEFNVSVTDRQKEETEKLIEALRNNPAIRYLFKANNIPEEYLRKSPWKLRDWLVAYKPCQGCRGLENCGQKKRGYYSSLVYDGLLHTEFKACKYMRSELQQTAHMKNYLVSDLGSSLHRVVFKSIDPEQETPAYRSVLLAAMNHTDSERGLFIYGTMGVGKTYLAACAANERARKGDKTAFIHYPTFTMRMAAQVNEGEYRTELKRLMYADFLVIDDIGAENCTEWNRDQLLLPLLNYRYENKKTTWFTSNQDEITLKIHFTFSSKGKEEALKAERIIERIRALAEFVPLSGKDRRKPL
ncbi:MAG: ATP-binding protein [Solobacterium sp.]|nr:ATP-binding protein [Solobacterium sp.]